MMLIGFKGMERMRVHGSDFVDSYNGLKKAFDFVRSERAPISSSEVAFYWASYIWCSERMVSRRRFICSLER
ncbi:MAG: hypothetical protein QM734_17495 [Cyclobacteriaceae bacterium]